MDSIQVTIIVYKGPCYQFRSLGYSGSLLLTLLLPNVYVLSDFSVDVITSFKPLKTVLHCYRHLNTIVK